MKKNFQRTRRKDLYEAILQLENIEECMDFFEDICAETELRSIEQRFEVARMLSKEKVYSDIMCKTSASTATISRVNRSLQYGANGYDIIFDRLEQADGKL